MTEGNKYCADCGTLGVAFVSVNNAVFLCSECGELHKSLDESVSIIKSINKLTSQDILIVSLGGNEKLHEFLENYSLNSFPAKDKYESTAARYYRANVKINITGS